MSDNGKMIASALVIFVLGGIGLIYGYAGLPPAGIEPNTVAWGTGNPTATIEPLARAAAPYMINGGSLFFWILAIVGLALIWRTPRTAHHA